MSLLLVSPSVEGARQPSAENKPNYGGTLVWGTQFKPNPINPVFTTYSISADLMSLVFNGLVRLNAKGEFEPDLAERWEISPDGLDYTFYLRKGVRFHDGVEVTARDVLFSYDQYRNPENDSPYRSKFSPINQVEIFDPYTIRFHLKEAVSSFIEQFIHPILPRHLLEGKNIRDNPFFYAPTGTGPFRFVHWDRTSDEIRLEFNPGYFEGRPYLDRIVVKAYPDPAAMWSGLLRHEVDLVQFISKEDYLVLGQDPAFKTFSVSAEVYSAIVYNLDDPVLADIMVRKAIAHSIDAQGILKRSADIQGTLSVGPIHPQSAGFNPDLKPFEYDPDEASRLLENNGWQDMNGDGILEKEGQDLEIRMLVNDRDPIHKKAALMIRQQLAAVGIRLIPQFYKNFSDIDKDYLDRLKIQAWLRYLPGYISNEIDAVSPWYSGFSMPGQFWFHKNAELDRLIEEARSEPDTDISHHKVQKIHRLIYEDQTACFLFFHEGFFALSAKFGGVEDYFNINMATFMIKDWYLTDRK